MSGESKDRVVVTIDDKHASHIESVADALGRAGMELEQVLGTVGVITGQVARSKMQALSEIDGVISIEPDQEMRAI